MSRLTFSTCLSFAVLFLICAGTRSRGAEPPADETKPVLSATADAGDVQPVKEVEKASEEDDKQAKKRPKKKEVILPDLSPEKATHEEVEPLGLAW